MIFIFFLFILLNSVNSFCSDKELCDTQDKQVLNQLLDETVIEFHVNQTNNNGTPKKNKNRLKKKEVETLSTIFNMLDPVKQEETNIIEAICPFDDSHEQLKNKLTKY